MSPLFIKCPRCGSNLDHGERCTCNGHEEEPKAVEKTQSAPVIKRCRECQTLWNVRKHANIPPSGYLCPECRKKHDKE